MHFLRTNRQRLELLLTFIVGIIWGATISNLLRTRKPDPDIFEDTSNFNKSALPNEFNFENLQNAYMPAYNHESIVAATLYNQTRVLCMVLTSPTNHEKRAQHVKRTWGRRCNKLIFVSTKQDDILGSIKVNAKEGRTNLWSKTREGFRYVYDNHFNDADWFIKADDDTFVILENLRAFLHPFSPKAALYFGCRFHGNERYATKGYMSGGAGYVLSKAALYRFVSVAYKNTTICKQIFSGAEDKEMGRCLHNVGVIAGDTRDNNDMARFFPLSPLHSFSWSYEASWYKKIVFYKLKPGKHDCCSDLAVTFHYIYPRELYILEYFIYNLRPFGIQQSTDVLPKKVDMIPLLEKWRDAKSDNLQ